MTALRPPPLTIRILALLWATCLVCTCGGSSIPSQPRQVVASRTVGSWQGAGNLMIGSIVSDTGRFRIEWETRNERPPGAGAFRLTVRSAVSGRPIQIVADHRGEGRGAADFDDGPRMYDFVVDSTGVDWSFTVHEVFVGAASGPSSRPER